MEIGIDEVVKEEKISETENNIKYYENDNLTTNTTTTTTRNI